MVEVWRLDHRRRMIGVSGMSFVRHRQWRGVAYQRIEMKISAWRSDSRNIINVT